MTNEKILGMLNSGEIEELKKLLQHEIYKKKVLIEEAVKIRDLRLC